MAHSLSAKKRIRQNAKHRARNRWRRDQVKQVLKDFDQAVQTNDQAKAAEQLQAVTKTLDKVAAKGLIHKNAVSRKKSRLAKRVNKLAAKA
ncbi:MAG TPA: 30S ribosomal protein S20 [Phycisphaerales bacterium]|nr:30S ribosomal protein S20 [Phycisphaerales bacterium]